MLSRLVKPAAAFALGVVLLVVSCAPAAEPTATPTTAPPPTTAPGVPTVVPPTLAPGVTPTAIPTSAPLIATPRPPTPTPAPVGEQPRRGGTFLTSGEASFQFGSWEECCSGFAIMMNDSILEYKPSGNPVGGDEEIRGRMAYDWAVSKDGLSWTFKLEPNMKAPLPKEVGGGFEVIDCEDAAWSFATIKSGEGLRRTMRGRTFGPVTRIDCPDPLTMVVHTKWPYAALPGMMAVSINDVKPKGYWQNRLKDLTKWVVGSGPWMLETHIPGEIIVMLPNPYYHRLAPDGKPYPYLDKIEMRAILYTACAAALRAGRMHACGTTGGISHLTGADLLYKEAKQLQFAGVFRAEDNPEWGNKGLLGNDVNFSMAHHEKAPWNNVKMREAISLAHDRRTMCNVGLEGWCTAGGFVFVMGTPWNLPKEQVWSYPGYNVNTTEENLARARQILTELGYKLYPDPAALKIDLPSWINSGPPVQPILVETLRRAGFNPTMYTPENQRVLSQAVSGEFDVINWDQAVSHNDPNQICYEHYFTGSDRNYGRYSSAQADALCDKMGQELDKTKRIALAHQYHKLILDDFVRATYAWRGGAFARHAAVRGIEISSTGSGGAAGRMEYTWLAK